MAKLYISANTYTIKAEAIVKRKSDITIRGTSKRACACFKRSRSTFFDTGTDNANKNGDIAVRVIILLTNLCHDGIISINHGCINCRDITTIAINTIEYSNTRHKYRRNNDDHNEVFSLSLDACVVYLSMRKCNFLGKIFSTRL